ncbi:hypothetical protein [Nocardioides campestrisoli]|uniref:hypothetical protein n=1 Tax=Nocardioides campestrisoli TaxID=2736757 RepID=UPI0015E71645|nr:hypothetical protein [Nocardioides campestrisoli]
MTARRHHRAALLTTTALMGALLSPGTAGAAAPAPDGTQARPAPERWVETAYGRGPIKVSKASGARIHLTFTGSRGDLVRLESQGHVATGARLNVSTGNRRLGRTVPAEKYSRWRLPASGRFTLTLRNRSREARLQLVKLREARLVPGKKVALPSRRGYGWWVTAAMPRKGSWAARLSGAKGVRWRAVHVAGDSSETYLANEGPYLATSAVALVAGSPPLAERGDSLRNTTKAPVRAGRPVHFYTTGGGSAHLLKGRTAKGQLDGPGQRVGRSGLLVSTVELPARTLVQEVAALPGGATADKVRSRILAATAPTSFPDALFTDEGGPQQVVTLATGAVRPKLSYGLRSTKSLGTLPPPGEGAPVTTPFVVDTPGQWLVARMAPTSGPQRVAVDSATLERWRLTFHPTYLSFCGAYSGHGCGDFFGSTIGPGQEHDLPTSAGTEQAPTFLLLRSGGQGTGTVDVTVERAY